MDQQAPGRADGVGATFGQLLDRWLEECERLDLSPTTLRNYRAQIKQTIRPRLGKVKLSQLTARHLDDLYGAMKDGGSRNPRPSGTITPSSRRPFIRPSDGDGCGGTWRNKPDRHELPNDGCKPHPSRWSEMSSRRQRRRDPRLAPLLMLAALTGMRRGELCALRWSDVDLTLGIIEVSRSVVVVVGGVAEKSTKTDRSRKVALDPVGIALLTAYRAHVDRWVAEAGEELPPDAFVFSPSVRGAVPYRPDNVTSFFIRVRDAVKAPDVRLHDLRHFTATQLIGAGMDIRTVADFLGHSDPSLTLRVYSHAIEERTKAAATIMGQVLSAERKKKPAELTSGG